jgi:hypothetical protein
MKTKRRDISDLQDAIGEKLAKHDWKSYEWTKPAVELTMKFPAERNLKEDLQEAIALFEKVVIKEKACDQDEALRILSILTYHIETVVVKCGIIRQARVFIEDYYNLAKTTALRDYDENHRKVEKTMKELMEERREVIKILA